MAVFGNLQEAVQELKRDPESPVRVRVDDLEIELRALVPVEKLPREGDQRVLSEEAEQDQLWDRLWEAVGTCHDPEGAEGVAKNHDRYLNRIYAGETDLR